MDIKAANYLGHDAQIGAGSRPHDYNKCRGAKRNQQIGAEASGSLTPLALCALSEPSTKASAMYAMNAEK